MRENNVFVYISIFMIRKIWHGRIGKVYKKNRRIICRFYPSCSNYAVLALQKYGFFKGWYLAYRRFKSCTNDNMGPCIDYP